MIPAPETMRHMRLVYASICEKTPNAGGKRRPQSQSDCSVRLCAQLGGNARGFCEDLMAPSLIEEDAEMAERSIGLPGR